MLLFKKLRFKLALKWWESERYDESIRLLGRLVDAGYHPAYVEYLKRIWGDGSMYDQFTRVMAKGILEKDLDCMYFDLWKTFSNRPDDDEYWEKIKSLAEMGQKTAVEILVSHNSQKEKLKPYVITEKCPDDELVNAELTNDEFNAEVFSKKRHLERRNISKGIGASYGAVREALMTVDWKSLGIRLMDGLTKNSWMLDDSEKESEISRHSMYLMKKLSDEKFMTLRIGDHTSNLGDYYKYRRMYVPSTRDYANMSIIFHGDREQNAQLKYSFRFRQETADPCVTVRDEDFLVYKPFPYTFVHYIPGLILDIRPLIDSIIEWFDNNGEKAFINPYRCDETSACARIQRGWATIETWDIKYERRRQEQANK